MDIKTGLKTGVKSELVIKMNSEITSKLKAFNKLWKSNGYLDSKDKFISSVMSETFSSLYTEGEISSRRLIKSNKLEQDNSVDATKIKNFAQSYVYTMKNNEISISNIFTLYSLLTKNIDMGDNSLPDGQMFRNDKVFISSNSINGDYEGIDHKQLPKAFAELIEFINNSDVDSVIKSIVAHIYFEIMHPFFDYDGRTGRFLPNWISNIYGQTNMRYFATAIGNFRETYLALFTKCIDKRTKEVDINRFVSGILDLLILNQHQYSYITEYNDQMYEETGKFLNTNQKNALYYLMIKYEKQQKASSWAKFDKDAIDFIEMKIKQPQLFREMTSLAEAGIILKSTTKPVKYKLVGYKLYK